VVVAEDDDAEDRDPVGTGDPLVQAVAPDPVPGEKQLAAPIVPSSCSVADCACPFEEPVRPTVQFVLAYALVPPRSVPRTAAMTFDRNDHLPSLLHRRWLIRVEP
jgi:hypothetical protein